MSGKGAILRSYRYATSLLEPAAAGLLLWRQRRGKEDATRLADASAVTIELDGGLDDDALRGGEDHALLACFPRDRALPSGFAAIGRVLARGGEPVTIAGVPVSGHLGWDPHHDWDAGRG